MNIDKDALRAAATLIRHEFGDVNDLPAELINTLANIYYQAQPNISEHARLSVLENIAVYGGSGDAMEAYTDYMNTAGHILSTIKNAPAMIKNMRATRTELPESWEFLVGVTLDILKYGIENVENMTPTERENERKKKNVREIPDLYKLMNLT